MPISLLKRRGTSRSLIAATLREIINRYGALDVRFQRGPGVRQARSSSPPLWLRMARGALPADGNWSRSLVERKKRTLEATGQGRRRPVHNDTRSFCYQSQGFCLRKRRFAVGRAFIASAMASSIRRSNASCCTALSPESF